MTMADDLRRDLYKTIDYVPDKKIHVSVVKAPDGSEYYDIREFVPSVDAYGRGITFPVNLVGDILDGLQEARRLSESEPGDG
jgi:hypothetical protein